MASRKKRTWAHEYKAPKRYNIEQKEGESELAYYRRLAKAADQRLVRLEKLSHEKDFGAVNKYAYSRAMADIDIYNPGGSRFNTKPPEDRRQFKEKIMDMRHFLESPTSTKAGVVETYQKRTDSFNKRFGTNFTWQELATYMDKFPHGKMKGFGYETSIKAIAQIRNRAEDLKQNIKAVKDTKVSGPEKEAMLAALRRPTILKAAGIDLNERQKDELRKQLKRM